MDLKATNYAQVTGKRLFITPNILSKTNFRLTGDEDRKNDLVLRNEHTDIDTVEIQIPEGYAVEMPFKAITLKTIFGTYTATAKVTPGKIIYFRKQEYFSGRFPVNTYRDFVQYYQQVYKSDYSKIVLVKDE